MWPYLAFLCFLLICRAPDASKEGGIRLIVGALGQSPAARVQLSVGRSLPSDMHSCVASISTTKPML